jgi:protein TonB
MKRRQNKCFIASVALHSLLVSLLVFGPAFVSSKTKSEEIAPLDFTPLLTTYDNAKGGGDPAAPQLPPRPPDVRPTPPTQPKQPLAKPPEPQQQKQETLTPPRAVEPTRKPAPEISDIDPRNIVKRKQPPQSRTPTSAENDAGKVSNERRKQAARILGQIVNRSSGGASAATPITLRGPGGGGLPYANFYQAVESAYRREWQSWIPKGITQEGLVVTTSVTIARDGSVFSSQIIRGSGNPEVDQAAEQTLSRVRNVPPLPATETKAQITITIEFEVKPTHSTG